MKRILIAFACMFYLMSCGNGNSGETGTSENDTNVEQVPSAIDTTTHPTGVNEGAVISTDTAAYNVENTNPDGRAKLDSDKKEDRK